MLGLPESHNKLLRQCVAGSGRWLLMLSSIMESTRMFGGGAPLVLSAWDLLDTIRPLNSELKPRASYRLPGVTACGVCSIFCHGDGEAGGFLVIIESCEDDILYAKINFVWSFTTNLLIYRSGQLTCCGSPWTSSHNFRALHLLTGYNYRQFTGQYGSSRFRCHTLYSATLTRIILTSFGMCPWTSGQQLHCLQV